IFQFSFNLILVEMVLCGLSKSLIRAISCIQFEGRIHLYAVELFFDFGLLLFIFLMSINRFFVITAPVDNFVHSNKDLFGSFPVVCWLLL
ncbi:hypothetical protein PFISCL1PPCAC_15164, partial [Pristionchus fissidentatus]